jgi:cobalt-zinc-cadmium efflux system outer membrane protein
VALASDLAGIASKSLRTVEATIRSGAVSPIEGERARVLLAQSELDRDLARRELEAARRVLAAVLGLDTPRFASLAGTLADTKPPPPLESYVAAIEGNPNLARWSSEIAKQRDALALATAKRIPDVTLSAGPRFFADDDSFAAVLGLSVPLPLFDRNQGEIQAAQSRLAKAPHERRSAELEIRESLALAYQDLSSAFEQIQSLRDSVIPRSEAVYQGLLDGYARGLFRYVDVLDAQRTLFELRGTHLTALASYHRAAAELARLTGAPLDPSNASRKVNP